MVYLWLSCCKIVAKIKNMVITAKQVIVS